MSKRSNRRVSQGIRTWARLRLVSLPIRDDCFVSDETPVAGRDTNLSAPPEKLSAFVARVLDQLSLSAWLPAAFLATALAVVYQMGSQEDLDVARAVGHLVADPVTLLIVTIPIVILTTLVTQSFSFEAIRALEGYWQRRWLLGWLHHALVTLRLKHKKALRARLPDLRDRAFNSARGSMLRNKRPQSVIDAIEADLSEIDREDLHGREELLRAATSWREYGDPTLVARYDRLRALLNDYPEDGLVMPTKLGNVMRSTEAKLRNRGGDVSSFALRRRKLVDPRTQLQHDQFRTRLDMYCILVFVSLALAAVSPLLLQHVPHAQRRDLVLWLLPPASFLLLGVASYRAAIASARGYCSILRLMDDAPGSAPPKEA